MATAVITQKVSETTDIRFDDISKETQNIASEISSSSNNNKTIVYTEEELDAIRRVRSHLIDHHNIDPNRIGLKTLALTTIVAKLRIEKAAEKYVKYLTALNDCGVPSLRDEEVFTINKSTLKECLNSYAICGRDHGDRSIMWIRSPKEPYPDELKTDVVRAGIMYHVAIHADSVSLRTGISMIFDSTEKNKTDGKELQKVWQSTPSRPKMILIAGASTTMRVIINALIKFASVFTKQKVLDLIKFVSMEEAVGSIPKESVPAYLGGNAGGIDKDIFSWLKERIDQFPVPLV